jgi:hypothetical protein
VTPEEFRATIANCIERDTKIRYHIQQGWHRLPISLGLFSGERFSNNRLRDLTHAYGIETDDIKNMGKTFTEWYP